MKFLIQTTRMIEIPGETDFTEQDFLRVTNDEELDAILDKIANYRETPISYEVLY